MGYCLGTPGTVNKNLVQNWLGLDLATSSHKTLLAMKTTAAMPTVVESCGSILLRESAGLESYGHIFFRESMGLESCCPILLGESTGFESSGPITLREYMGLECCGFILLKESMGLKNCSPILLRESMGHENCGPIFLSGVNRLIEGNYLKNIQKRTYDIM